MGIYKPTAIAGETSNSVDKLTFCNVRGRNVVRTKIQKNPSKTLPQQKQRYRWSLLQNLDLLFDAAILIGFPSRPEEFTVHNAFIKTNARCITVTDELEATTDYSKIVCSDGRLSNPNLSVTLSHEEGSLTFARTAKRFGPRQKPTDEFYAFIVEKALQESQLIPLGTREDTKPTTVTLPAEWDYAELAVYVFAVSADKRTASRSKFLPLE